jgi:hypothetical protein
MISISAEEIARLSPSPPVSGSRPRVARTRSMAERTMGEPSKDGIAEIILALPLLADPL